MALFYVYASGALCAVTKVEAASALQAKEIAWNRAMEDFEVIHRHDEEFHVVSAVQVVDDTADPMAVLMASLDDSSRR